VVQTPPPAPPPAPPAPTTEDYTVIKGDTFASIAKKSGVTTRAIQEANPGVDAKKLKIGQKLHLPSGGAAANASTSAPASTPGAADTSPSGGEQTYKVKSGDTLTSIAKHFHVTIKAIQSANHLTTTSIKVGQSLKVPGSAASAPVSAPAQVEPTLPPPVPVATSAPAPASPTAPAH
jgi:LysM repeat protein